MTNDDIDFTGMTSQEVGRALSEKTIREMKEIEYLQSHPIQESRNWKDSNGFQYLGVWQNAALLRVLIRKFTSTLPTYQTNKGRTLNPTLNQPLKSEHRLVAQMDDCARSVKRNIEEGFKRPTSKEYLEFLGFSQASLEELKGDIYDCKTDGYLPSKPITSLKETLHIDLRVIKGPDKGNNQTFGEPTEPGHPYCQPLTTLNPSDLTYEIFMELINKTDYLLRQLVVSLENKLSNDKKYYQVEQIRLNRRARGNP